MSTFNSKLKQLILKNNSNLCIGMDPDLNLLPNGYSKKIEDLYSFLRDVIEYTFSFAIAYKFNFAFYYSLGKDGLDILKQILKELNSMSIKNKKILIADVKIGDIENTAKHYAKAFFELWNFDAITLNPFMGFDAIKPFLEYQDKGSIILCLTSNPSNLDFEFYGNPPLYQEIAKKIYMWNENYDNILAVVGATNKKNDLIKIKEILKEIPILVPGIGAQGGDLKVIKEIFGNNTLINIGRSILYASNNKETLKIKIEEYIQKIQI